MGNQFAFTKGIATEDAIFKLTNEMLNASNNKTMACSSSCDLEKTFNSVKHELLSYHIIFVHLPLDLQKYRNSHNNTYYIKVCSAFVITQLISKIQVRQTRR